MAEENELIRAFISITLSNEAIKEVANIQEQISKVNLTGKMTELNNLHLTLKFLGEIEKEKIEEVKKALRTIKFFPFEVKLGQMGVFGGEKNPKIVWVKLDGKSIWDIQKSVDSVLEKIGFAKEERFMSHITLARIKYVKDKKGFVNFVKNLNSKHSVFRIEEFKLKKSELYEYGPEYKDLEVYKANDKN
jgi:2'-5' RNA ligase